MKTPRLEVADILRSFYGPHRDQLGSLVSYQQEYVIHAIMNCRTHALGGHLYACDRCGIITERYNSCRNRHCPKCQHLEKLRWLEARSEELLPVQYFHTVFTIPCQLNSICLDNQKIMYDLLLRSSARALMKIAADPKFLGAKIGALAVLHTWGSRLQFHPHCHCIVPGGGFSLDGEQWLNCQADFLLPVRVLSSYFKGYFLAQLRAAAARHDLRFSRDLDPDLQPRAYEYWLDELYSKDWVVYTKSPFGGAQKVLQYLARYTYRVAISNRRLLRIEDDRVYFLAKDSRKNAKFRETSLEAREFVRRFLLHVLPRGFVRIRYYGYLANSQRRKQLTKARKLIRGAENADDDQGSRVKEEEPPETWEQRVQRLTGIDPTSCPACGEGKLVKVGKIEPTLTGSLRKPRPPPNHI